MDALNETFDAWRDYPHLVQLTWLGGLALAWLAVDLLLRTLVLPLVEKLVLRSRSDWDDALHESKLFERLAPLIPALLAQQSAQLIPALGEPFTTLVERVSMSVVVLVVARSLGALLTAADLIYMSRPQNRERPIKGYLQVVKLLIAVIATILILATLFDRSPVLFLSGLGAMTAVTMLIFQDTILSLVASVQISTGDMVRVGDWIEMPQLGADGDVIDIALHTVKVQNWDKTVTHIPTHRLISESFKNWRYMSESGGRRIKRSLLVDLDSVRFLEDEEVERFGELALLRDYMAGKRSELEEWNARDGIDPQRNADIRRLTNLGTFRAYVERYLRADARIRKDMTLLVRHLALTEHGLPIEIYCFTNTTSWNEYEGIQADLFDHFLAVAGDFGLRAFQSPSSAALEAAARALAETSGAES